MWILGLTGPSGAGKGTVASILSECGFPILDADQIYHGLLIPPSPCLDSIVEHFGEEVLHSDGTLNRPTLASRVFSDPQELKTLNRIAHRFVLAEIERRLSALETKQISLAVIDAPQLFESGADQRCNKILSVLADPTRRRERILSRDRITPQQAESRMRSQHSDAFFREHSDAVLENNGSIDDLRRDVLALLAEWGVSHP